MNEALSAQIDSLNNELIMERNERQQDVQALKDQMAKMAKIMEHLMPLEPGEA